MEVGPGDTVLHGDTTPNGKGHSSPHFSAHVYYDKRSPISATAELLFVFILSYFRICGIGIVCLGIFALLLFSGVSTSAIDCLENRPRNGLLCVDREAR